MNCELMQCDVMVLLQPYRFIAIARALSKRFVRQTNGLQSHANGTEMNDEGGGRGMREDTAQGVMPRVCPRRKQLSPGQPGDADIISHVGMNPPGRSVVEMRRVSYHCQPKNV